MSRREVSRTDGAGTGRHEGAGAQPSGQRGLGRLGLTSRAFILAAAVVLVFVMITPSLGVYFKQRSQLADLTAQQAQQTRTIAQLQDELKRWDDPDYVRTQARSQLGWVVPGETGYRVIGKNGKVLGAGAELDASGDTTGLTRRVSGGRRWSAACERPTPRPGPPAGDPGQLADRTGRDGRTRRLVRLPGWRKDVPVTRIEPFTDQDRSAVADQLGREPRAVVGVAWRCSCGRPGVIATLPRLPGGSPFPTTYYLTCPALASRIGTIEASGEMARMAARLGTDPALAESYRRAHLAYLADRAHFAEQACLAPVPEIEGISAERDADPGEVPARPGSTRAGGRPRGQPLRGRGGGDPRAVPGTAPCGRCRHPRHVRNPDSRGPRS